MSGTRQYGGTHSHQVSLQTEPEMATLSLNFHAPNFFGALRLRRSAKQGRAEPIRVASTAAPTAPAIAGREVSQRRAEAMRGFFPKVSAWMARRSHLAEMRSVDRYLSQSTDLFDLERRIREVERGGSSARWCC